MLGPYQRQNCRRRARRRRDRHQRIRPAYDDFVDTVFWGAVVTGRVYDLSPRMQEKRNVRYAVAAELRRIVGEPVQMEHEMRQAA